MDQNWDISRGKESFPISPFANKSSQFEKGDFDDDQNSTIFKENCLPGVPANFDWNFTGCFRENSAHESNLSVGDM